MRQQCYHNSLEEYIVYPLCPSINLKQPVIPLVLFVTYQLSCEIRYLVSSVPLRLLVLNQRMQDSILYWGFSF